MLHSTRPRHFARLISLAMGGLLCCSLAGCNTETPAPASGVETPQAVSASSARIAVDAGVVVVDMEQSLGFYRDLIGLPVVAEVTTSLIGKGRMVQLKHGASLIKLVEMEEAPSGRSATGIPTTFGYRYITLLVTDIDAIVTKIEQNEVPIALPVTELGNGAVIVMVEDPDGNIVEFVQEARG